VKREDRVARLEALLARVRANVAARGDRPRSLLSYRPDPLPEEEQGHAPLPILVQRASFPVADEPTLEALSQRALALTTADALLAGARAADPIEEPGWPASVRPAAADAHVVAAHEPIEEEPAPSRLERAVREAAAEQQLSPLLFEAAAELREHERRPLSEPPPANLPSFLAPLPVKVPEAPVFIPAPIRTPPIIYADPDEVPRPVEPPRALDHYADLDAAFHPRAPEPIAVVREPERGTWMLWAGAAAGALLVLAGAWLVRDTAVEPEPARAVNTTVTDTLDTPSPAHPPGRPSARPTATLPSADASALAARPVPPEPSFEPPDTSGLPVDRGLIWVDAHVVREVYVMGDVAGQTGKWLRVPCGLRNVRTAQPGPPPAGSSFPIWTSEGHSVLIPCRSYTRVTMPTDP
jgi:hypothetical protein